MSYPCFVQPAIFPKCSVYSNMNETLRKHQGLSNWSQQILRIFACKTKISNHRNSWWLMVGLIHVIDSLFQFYFFNMVGIKALYLFRLCNGKKHFHTLSTKNTVKWNQRIPVWVFDNSCIKSEEEVSEANKEEVLIVFCWFWLNMGCQC